MANYSHQSYPDSGNSSPLSREIDSDNPASWDEPPPAVANYKVKFMCSYGGQIQPRSHDNSLSYVGGDTKILSLERNTAFSAVIAKLSSICDAASPSEICFKYQLPGEDLDALISVTNDEDLEHLMLEYDRLNRSSLKPAKLRIFLFTLNSKPNLESPKPDGNWFVDALNSVQYKTPENLSPRQPTNQEPSNPDFLFGFDNTTNYKVNDPNPNSANDVSPMSDHLVAGEQIDSIQSQMETFQIGEKDVQKSFEEVNPNLNTAKMYQSEYYMVQEKASSAPTQAAPVHASYWPERQQPVYMIQTPAGGVYYQNPPVRQVAGAHLGSGQAYYNVPRAVPETYREQPAYNAVAPPSSLIQRQMPMVAEQGYAQVTYVDSSGRPMYYTQAPPPQYQMVATAAGAVVDGRSVGGVGMGFDGKVVGGKAT